MQTDENEEFRNLLLAERGRLQSTVDHIHAEHPGSIEDELGEVGSGTENHLGDTASATFDRAFDEGLEESAQQTLAEIDAALGRLDAGTYGACEVCGKPIVADRLRVIPWARFCIDDQRRVG